MASKNTPNSKSRGDTKNIKIKNSSEMSTVVALSRASENFDLVNSSDSFHCEEKGLQISEKSFIEVKDETDASNIVDSTLDNKSSTSSVKILKTAKTSSSAIEKTTVKKEASNEEESLFEVPAYTPTPIKPAKIRDVQDDEANSVDTAGESGALSNENKLSNKVISLAAKNLSDEERRQLRAKRFNIVVAESSHNDTQEQMTRKVSTPSYKSAPSTTNYPTPTYDTLKKRAERFGENVSTVMKSLDHKEKMLKRKLKFLESVTNLKELEIKKRRAERFRMV